MTFDVQNLRTPHLTPEGLAELLEALVRPSLGLIEDTPDGKVSFDGLISSMRETVHSDDDYHHGESILEHVTEVFNYTRIVAHTLVGIDDDTRTCLFLTALMHDVAKPVAHKMHATIPGKHQFPNHWNSGVPVAQTLLSRSGLPAAITDRVCYMVEHHHDIYHMVDARKRYAGKVSPARQVQYLTKFLRDDKDKKGLLNDMCNFMACDTVSSRLHVQRVKEGEVVIEDVVRYRELEASGGMNFNVDPKAKNAPYYQGVEAAASGESVEDNPYAVGTVEAKRWEIGFHQPPKG